MTTPITIALLDRLDARMDRIRDNGATNGSYWPIRQWIDAQRNKLEPMVIYPEPAPIINCPHPPDKDYCGLWFDLERDEMRMWRGCRICGEVWDLPLPPEPKEEKPKGRGKRKK